MARQSTLKIEERKEAVLSVLRREETAAVVARRYSISEPTLAAWRNQFIEGGKGALQPGSKERNAHQRELEELRRQLAQRDQVIGELTIANRILKKTGHPLS